MVTPVSALSGTDALAGGLSVGFVVRILVVLAVGIQEGVGELLRLGDPAEGDQCSRLVGVEVEEVRVGLPPAARCLQLLLVLAELDEVGTSWRIAEHIDDPDYADLVALVESAGSVSHADKACNMAITPGSSRTIKRT